MHRGGRGAFESPARLCCLLCACGMRVRCARHVRGMCAACARHVRGMWVIDHTHISLASVSPSRCFLSTNACAWL
jgi:hypothetical protein